MKKISLLLAASLMTLAASAQMTFTFSNGVTATTETNPEDGSTTITVPAGTDLSGLITAVQIDGTTVTASQITPDPTSTKIDWGELEVFTYNNKAYGFRFVEDVWFCAVFISDCHTDQGSGTTSADLTTITNNIIAMGQDGTKKVTFTGVEGLPSTFVPKTSIVFCTGDIDQDKGNDGSSGTHENFLKATSDHYKTAGIPFIFIAGNHDFSPDYWTGSDGGAGVTYGNTGGSHADDQTITAIKNNNSYWNSFFDNTLEYFTTGNNRAFEPQHFTFKYKDVRFYCANNYWFQKPHSAPGLLSSATYYAPDPIINNLETFVGNHASEASVWMQHYSFNVGTDIKRWWLDQNDVGKYIKTSNSSEYGTNADVELWSNTGGTATQYANLKRDKLASIIEQTQNPVHFSGHAHYMADDSWTNNNHNITGKVVSATFTSGNNAYVVLLKRGEGVKAIVQANFH